MKRRLSPKSYRIYSIMIIEFIEGLIKKGAAYNVNGNVYFDIIKLRTMENYLKKI